MARRSLAFLRLLLGFLTGLLLWLVWQASTVTTPELEAIRFRYMVSLALFGTDDDPTKAYTVFSNWRGLLPLAVLCAVVFASLKPWPRFLTLILGMIVAGIVGVYCFHVFRFIVPLGGPAILICACYLCGSLVHSETERLESNQNQALDLQRQAENERQRIAKDLHDESLPSLSRVIRLADELQKQYSDSPIPQEMRSRLEASISEMRRVINDLHPAVLEELGLMDALQYLVEDFTRQSGVATTFRGTDKPVLLSKFDELCIYRIAQEALNNIEKHAHASEAELSIIKTDNLLLFKVSDNGNGVGTKKVGTHGLQNIAHRAKLIGGIVEWTKPDKYESGTMLVLCVTCPDRKPPGDNGRAT